MILFNDTPVEKVSKHKHLGIIRDSKLSFSAHSKSTISKTRKGIGLLKYLSSHLPRHTLNELYKLYVRPHLDYGDVIYHIPAKICNFSQNIILPNLMENLSLFSTLLPWLLPVHGGEHLGISCTQNLVGSH